MVDLELVALSITSVLLVAAYSLDHTSEFRSIYTIGVVGSVLDLVLHILRITYYSLPQIVNGLDFANYYIYFSLLFALLWYRSEGTGINETTESVVLLTTVLVTSTSILYTFTNNELFLTIALIFFSLLGVISSAYLAINHYGTDRKSQQIIVIGGIILCITMFLYPSFLFNRLLFLSCLVLFYLGWVILLIGTILHNRSWHK